MLLTFINLLEKKFPLSGKIKKSKIIGSTTNYPDFSATPLDWRYNSLWDLSANLSTFISMKSLNLEKILLTACGKYKPIKFFFILTLLFILSITPMIFTMI